MATTTNAPTLSSLLLDRLDTLGDSHALHYVRDGQALSLTWNQLAEHVFAYASVLNSLGIGPGDRVVQWSENRMEWILTDLALIVLRAVHVPLHSTLSGRQAVDQALHADPKLVIVSKDDLVTRIMKLQAELPTHWKWLSYEPVRARVRAPMSSMGTLLPAADIGSTREYVKRDVAECQPEDLATILYTSGTTGESKGIMLSHNNLLSNAMAVVNTFEHEKDIELRLNFLPLSHIYARTCDVYTWLLRGSELALTQNRDTIIDDCKRFRPTLINGVPFFYERVRQKLVDAGKADQPGVLQSLFGGKIRGCFSGGGALAEHTYDYYVNQQGVLLLQGYGLTESSPVITFSTPEAHRSGSAGIAIRGIELKIAEDGEILTRGPHVMLGYFRDDMATREAIRDGWLHTGDLGTMDADGFLRITGRKKEMIVTSTGKNVFPGHIEALLCRDPLILQAMVVGDRRDYLTALIVPDPDILRAAIKRQGLWVFSRRGAVRHPKVRQMYRECMDRQLADMARHEQVKAFTLLDHGFTPESGYMTAKLSLRRSVIERDHAREINEMYRT